MLKERKIIRVNDHDDEEMTISWRQTMSRVSLFIAVTAEAGMIIHRRTGWTSAVSIYAIWMEWESIPKIRRWWWWRERSMTSRKEFLCILHLIECLCYLSLVIWSSAFLSSFSEFVVCLSRLGKFYQNWNPEIQFPSPSVTQLPYILSVLTKEVPFCRLSLSPSWGDR